MPQVPQSHFDENQKLRAKHSEICFHTDCLNLLGVIEHNLLLCAAISKQVTDHLPLCITFTHAKVT